MDRSGPFSISPSSISARDATQVFRSSVFSVAYISPHNQPPRTNTLICTHPVHCDVARGTQRSPLPAGDIVQSVPPSFPSHSISFIFLSRLRRWVEQFMYLLNEGEGKYATNFRCNIKLRWVGRSFDPQYVCFRPRFHTGTSSLSSFLH